MEPWLPADTVGGLGPDAIVNRLSHPLAPQSGTLDPLQTACLTVTCQGNARPVSCTVSSSSYLVEIAAVGVVVPGDPGSVNSSDYHCAACFMNNDSTNAQTIEVRPVCWTPLE